LIFDSIIVTIGVELQKIEIVLVMITV
jgi:hypothetical protein